MPYFKFSVPLRKSSLQSKGNNYDVITKCKHQVLENVKQLPPLKKKRKLYDLGQNQTAFSCHVY